MFAIVVLALSIAVLAVMVVTSLAVFEVAFQTIACPRPPQQSSRSRSILARTAERKEPVSTGDGAICPSGGEQQIGVTPPEVFAIADQLRKSRSSSEVQRVRGVATSNAKTAKGLNQEQYSAAHITCPLLAEGGCCLAFDMRPIHCRSWCRTSSESGRLCQMNDDSAEAGITRGLGIAGLDGDVYELNSALAVVLSSTDSAHRWAKGEKVFSGSQV